MFGPVIDVSAWQGDINVDKFLAAGAKAMYIKAGGIDKSNGICYPDWQFRKNAKKFSKVIPCGYYFFFYPHFDGTTQAEYFCDLLKSVDWNLPPAVDVESNPLNVNQSRFQRELKEFLDTVESILGVKSVIYTRATVWNPHVGSPSWAKNYKLWVAAYSETMQHPWNNDPNTYLRPKPWDDYWMWQYSADKNGRGPSFGVATAGIDVNKVNMSKDEFYTFARWGDVPEPSTDTGSDSDTAVEEIVLPPPTTIDENTAEKSKYPHQGFLRNGYTSLRLRSRPTAHEDNTVGEIKRGSTFTVHKEHPFGDDLWWLIEMPDGTVGWGARRYRGKSYLALGG